MTGAQGTGDGEADTDLASSSAAGGAGDPAAGPEVVLGGIAAPGAPHTLAEQLLQDLPAELAHRSVGVRWRIEVLPRPLVEPPASDREIVSAARELLLSRGWDLAVCLTDLPLRVARRPVVGHASPVHAVAVLCVPALGAVGLRRRARDTVLRLLDTLLGEPAETAVPTERAAGRFHRIGRRARALGTDPTIRGRCGSPPEC